MPKNKIFIIIIIVLVIAVFVLTIVLISKKNTDKDTYYTVTLESKTYSVKANSYFDPPPLTTYIDIINKKKYSFNGWYRDIACTVPWIYGEHRVTCNITLYAKWEEIPYKIY